ncbi:aspartate carbamoyltransferase catalytic subunit [Exiguobacterium oxidotolerans]|uniref:aspartate carbamoyltransferase catalytic subunit n=1 Tax=Exiguobacterium oxidotolerans TaxID=223958 RepID=UPI000493E259|nr:aspartate carbamoyltransferase catalytic subunit [Exiguobacterium oxidotolerans]
MKTQPVSPDFVSLDRLSVLEIEQLIERALELKHGQPSKTFANKTIANLFFENSTRTRCSFEMAEHRLGMHVLPFETTTSSVQKGETLLDTCKTLEALGVEVLVIRHQETGYYHALMEQLTIPIINAGDGSGQHPSQSLLDLMTMYEVFGHIHGKTVVICGDLRHSRVARSNADVLQRLGATVIGSGPPEWFDETMGIAYVPIDEAIEQSDIIMLLRVQQERHNQAMELEETYHEQYGLTLDRMRRVRPEAIILHPAPVNRGIEIADELVEHTQSRIFEQMKNGVFARMAILERAFHPNSTEGAI